MWFNILNNLYIKNVPEVITEIVYLLFKPQVRVYSNRVFKRGYF